MYFCFYFNIKLKLIWLISKRLDIKTLQIRNKTHITVDSQLKKDNLTELAKIKNIKYYRQPIKPMI